MPNTEIIKEWVAALRSGEYEQGQNALKTYREFNNAKGQYGEWEELDKPTFCCLGVLCDIAEQKGIVKAQPDERGAHVGYDGAIGLPPVEVEKWAGFYNEDWSVAYPDGLEQNDPLLDCMDGCEVCEAEKADRPKRKIALASLNDNHAYNFNQIADAIEKEWLVDA